MKSKIYLTLVLVLGGVAISNAQSEKISAIKQDTVKRMNIIDEQVNILNSVFEMGGAAENPFSGATDYLQLLEQSDMDPELKETLKEQYDLYDTSLDATRKEELKIKMNKMLNEAIDKGLIAN